MPDYEVRLAGYVLVVAEDEDGAVAEALNFCDMQDVDIESVTLVEGTEPVGTEEEEPAQ